ncbi:MAG: hypothetical protein ACE5JA_01785 [bacterium]
MRTSIRRITGHLIPLILVFSSFDFAGAVATSFFRSETFEDFSKGSPDDTSIRHDGTVALSPPLTQKFESLEPYIWCVALDQKGNIYAGAGSEGKVYKIRPDGKSRVIFDSPEAEILSVVVDQSGRLYAGTAPNGIIYEVGDSGGEVFFDSEEKYIWSMAVDKKGNIIAGTGDGGNIYRVKKDGKAEIILESDQTNITVVAVHKGKIYAGSADDGIVYLIDGKKTKVLFDTPEKEVRSILFDDAGNVLVGSTNGEPLSLARRRRASPDEKEGEKETRSAEAAASAIYRLAEDGTIAAIVPLRSYTLLSMAMLPDGHIVVGTSQEGRLLRVGMDMRIEILNRVDAVQVISLISNGELVLSTGDMGKVYTLGKTFVREGRITSSPFDAGMTSSWGAISWNGDIPKGTSIKLQTRSGNTEKPDRTWSEWSESYDESRGSKVTSPKARFIQWRAVLSTKDPSVTPVLRDVSLAYLQKNLKPVIFRVSVKPAGGQKKGEAELSAGKRHQELRGHLTVSWEVVDPNEDSLEYSVEFKGTGQRNWLTMEEDLRQKSFTFDSQSLPDGKYRMRVKASDSPSNPDDFALSDVRESDPFVMDNAPPEVFRMGADVKPGRKYRVTFQVEDETTPVASCEYSVDAKPWRPVFPIDQIFDTKEESFVLQTPGLSAGQHIVVVRVTDTAGNISTKRLIINVK